MDIRPELRKMFEDSWAYNEPVYRYLGRHQEPPMNRNDNPQPTAQLPMFNSPNPTLFDLLRAGATVTFADGATLEGKYDPERDAYVQVQDQGGKGPWEYGLTHESLGRILLSLGLQLIPVRYRPNPQVEKLKAILINEAYNRGCSVTLIDAIGFCRDVYDLNFTMRIAYGPGAEDLKQYARSAAIGLMLDPDTAG